MRDSKLRIELASLEGVEPPISDDRARTLLEAFTSFERSVDFRERYNAWIEIILWLYVNKDNKGRLFAQALVKTLQDGSLKVSTFTSDAILLSLIERLCELDDESAWKTAQQCLEEVSDFSKSNAAFSTLSGAMSSTTKKPTSDLVATECPKCHTPECSGHYDLVKVHYVTNRKLHSATARQENPYFRFTEGREPRHTLRHESVYVSVPELMENTNGTRTERVPGVLSPAGIQPLTMSEYYAANRCIHFLIEPKFSTYKDVAQFNSSIATELSRGRGRTLFVFIHGVGTTLPVALIHAAQIFKDSGFDGAPVVLSWATSRRAVNIAWQYYVGLSGHRDLVNRFATIIADMCAACSANKVVLMGHSMGCALILDIIEVLATSAPLPSKLTNVILGAPAIEVEDFSRRLGQLTLTARSSASCAWTSYTNQNDMALFGPEAVSLWQKSLAGRSPGKIANVVECVDLTHLSRHAYEDWYKHSSFSYWATTDLHDLVEKAST